MHVYCVKAKTEEKYKEIIFYGFYFKTQKCSFWGSTNLLCEKGTIHIFFEEKVMISNFFVQEERGVSFIQFQNIYF